MWMQGPDPGEPSQADVGSFIPTSELLQWHREMQKKYPTIFTPDDKLFGNDGRQHKFGTKLFAIFDDDPNQLMRCEVVGSRYVEGEPMYVVKIGGELSQIALTGGHEEAGWKIDNTSTKFFDFMFNLIGWLPNRFIPFIWNFILKYILIILNVVKKLFGTSHRNKKKSF